jgi:hypothetical protein
VVTGFQLTLLDVRRSVPVEFVIDVPNGILNPLSVTHVNRLGYFRIPIFNGGVAGRPVLTLMEGVGG